MTGAQYKNIIQWTLMMDEKLNKLDSLSIVRKIFDCLGVSFPHGGFEDIINILETNIYMGWRSCSLETAGRFADIGVASIAMDSQRVIIIDSNDSLNNLTDSIDTGEIFNDYVKGIEELQTSEYVNMHYFTYSYGQVLNE